VSPLLHIEGDVYTDERIRAGAAMGIFRQCSIGYHFECSDPPGDECRCRCHRIIRKAVRKAQKQGLIP
jgi:hypothetical protein